MKEINKETIKKILKENLPEKKGVKIDDLVKGLHKWFQVDENKKKVKNIVKNGCSKQKGGGKTRKRKRKRKKRTRSRRGGNGDEEWWNNAAFTGMAVMIGFGMYLLFELFPPNNPLRRFRQRRESSPTHELALADYNSDEETKESAPHGWKADIFH